jgi:hypothetical protein
MTGSSNTATMSFGHVEPPAAAGNDAVQGQWSEVVDWPWGVHQLPSIQRLLTLSNLEKDWDSYGSQPPSEAAIAMGVTLLKGLLDVGLENLTTPRINPVSGGGILLEWEAGSRELELELQSGGVVRYLKVEHGEPVQEDTVTHPMFSQMRDLLVWLTS